MNVNKRLFLLILILSFFLVPIVFAQTDDTSLSYHNEDTKYVAKIEDNANLLTQNEKEMLLEDMQPLTEYGNIVFLSINVNSNTTKDYASEYYHKYYSTESGSLFLIDMDNREIYIFSDGSNYNIINDSKAYSITDNTYQYASNEDYYQCASIAFSQMNTLLAGGKILEPMKYTSNIFISLTISFFLTFLFVLSQMRIKKASSDKISSQCDVSFNMGEVTAKKNGVRRKYSPMSSSSNYGGSSFGSSYSGGGFSSGSSHSSGGFSSGSSHSSGGGGFSGGGHSSGGGGGHRF